MLLPASEEISEAFLVPCDLIFQWHFVILRRQISGPALVFWGAAFCTEQCWLTFRGSSGKKSLNLTWKVLLLKESTAFWVFFPQCPGSQTQGYGRISSTATKESGLLSQRRVAHCAVSCASQHLIAGCSLQAEQGRDGSNIAASIGKGKGQEERREFSQINERCAVPLPFKVRRQALATSNFSMALTSVSSSVR